MGMFLDSVMMDGWIVVPILLCSVLAVGVVIEKLWLFKNSRRDIEIYLRELNNLLEKNDLNAAKNLAIRCGGVIGEVIEESVRIFSDQKKGFSRSFDISAALATRQLESHLTVLGTIGGIAPFLGLLGTVVRILCVFHDLPKLSGNVSTIIASGIGSALIATALGLGVAIIAVMFYNLFQSKVKHFEDDFQLIKLLFLSFIDSEPEVSKYSSKINL